MIVVGGMISVIYALMYRASAPPRATDRSMCRRRGSKPKIQTETMPNNFIGKSHPRIDARGKVTGATPYSGDLSMPGMFT
jgi:hypothetical protein